MLSLIVNMSEYFTFFYKFFIWNIKAITFMQLQYWCNTCLSDVNITNVSHTGKYFMGKLFSLLVLTSTLLISNLTHASVINIIDFEGLNEGVQDSFYFEEAGVGLTITAWGGSVNSSQELLIPFHQIFGLDPISGEQLGVYKGSTGLGVNSNSEDGSDLDGGSSSNTNDPDEALLFQFSEVVNFLGFAAGELSSNDDLNLSIVNFVSATEFELFDIFIDREGSPSRDIFDVFPGILGDTFLVWVDGNDDDVRIIETAFIKVPEPSSLAIFSLALLALVRIRQHS